MILQLIILTHVMVLLIGLIVGLLAGYTWSIVDERGAQ